VACAFEEPFSSLEARSLEHIAVRWILAAGAEKSILDVNSCGVPAARLLAFPATMSRQRPTRHSLQGANERQVRPLPLLRRKRK
jgi:hypothetical protein